MEARMITQESSKVTLESLFQIKKAEKPDESFWAKFEQDLERKRLQSLIKSKRPGFVDTLSQFWKRSVPSLSLAGAACAVAITLSRVFFTSAAPTAVFMTEACANTHFPSAYVAQNQLTTSMVEIFSAHSMETSQSVLNYSSESSYTNGFGFSGNIACI
jgi:hypothetical protein